MIIYIYVCVCVYLNKIFFVRNYDFIYMIMFNLTMKLFWYPANRGYSLVLWYLNQWGLFIGTLIPSQWGFIHWYFDTQTNGGLFIGTLIPSQWRLFIGILIPKLLWYLANRGYSLVFWCPITGKKRDHSNKIVKNMNYVWIFELFWVLKTTYVILEMFEYLNYFESLKLLMCFWNLL